MIGKIINILTNTKISIEEKELADILRKSEGSIRRNVIGRGAIILNTEDIINSKEFRRYRAIAVRHHNS